MMLPASVVLSFAPSFALLALSRSFLTVVPLFGPAQCAFSQSHFLAVVP